MSRVRGTTATLEVRGFVGLPQDEQADEEEEERPEVEHLKRREDCCGLFDEDLHGSQEKVTCECIHNHKCLRTSFPLTSHKINKMPL